MRLLLEKPQAGAEDSPCEIPLREGDSREADDLGLPVKGDYDPPESVS